jgi:hypothetical protein
MGRDGGRGWRLVPPIVLDEASIHARFKPMGRLAVSQGVDRGTRMAAALLKGRSQGILHTGAWHGPGGGCHTATATAWGGKEPHGMAGCFPGLAE